MLKSKVWNLPARNIMFLKIFYENLISPWAGQCFGPGAIMFTNLVGDHELMLHAKYQVWAIQLQERIFLKIFLCKTDKPFGRAIFGQGVII